VPKISKQSASTTETAPGYEGGEAYFAPPGHTPELHAGTELVEFSPSAELERTLEVVMRNVAAMQASS
jgi:hypothetical protein